MSAAPKVNPAVQDVAGSFELSVIIVSYNTRETLRECLNVLYEELRTLSAEVFVVENASRDGSGDMVEHDFPAVRLVRSETNLGFGAANNVALAQATGRYFVLLNSDAFPARGVLARSIEHMDETPLCGLGGGLLIGRDGASQPSARCFHSVTGDAIVMSGLASRYPKSRIFGHVDRTWADEKQACCVDWVPGALHPEALCAAGCRSLRPCFFPLLRRGGSLPAYEESGLSGVVLAGYRDHTYRR